MKNRWTPDLSAFTVEPLDTAAFQKKVRECDSRLDFFKRTPMTTLDAHGNRSRKHDEEIVFTS